MPPPVQLNDLETMEQEGLVRLLLNKGIITREELLKEVTAAQIKAQDKRGEN